MGYLRRYLAGRGQPLGQQQLLVPFLKRVGHPVEVPGQRPDLVAPMDVRSRLEISGGHL